MATLRRIYTDQPSSGLSYPIRIKQSAADANTWITLCQAPDFSVPLEDDQYSVIDPEDSTRAIVPGEILIMTPLIITNHATNAATFSMRIVEEGNGTEEVMLTPDEGLTVLPGKSIQFPLQGQSLIKANRTAMGGEFGTGAINASLLSAYGEALEIKFSVANKFSVVGTVAESILAAHAFDTEREV
jgi:hypothetical protein